MRQNPDTAWRRAGEEVFILLISSRRLVSLNAAGALVWELCGDGAEEEALIGEVCRRAGRSGDGGRTAVGAFLEELAAMGLLVREGEEPRTSGASSYNGAPFDGPPRGGTMKRLRKLYEEESRPLAFLLELTGACPLRCRHCYLKAPQPGGLTVEEITSALDDLQALGCMEVILSGGEPMLHPDFIEIVKRARQRKFLVVVKSSGWLIDGASAAAMRDAGVNEAHLSLYSSRPGGHDSVTGIPGSHARLLGALQALTASGIPVKLSAPLTAGTYRDCREMAELSRSLGAPIFFDPFITLANDGSADHLSMRLGEEQLAELFADPGIAALLERRETYFVSGEGNLRGDDSPPCEAGRLIGAVGFDGAVYPCISFPHRVGSIRESSLANVWRRSEALAELRSIKNSDLSECRACSLRSHCPRCPGVAFLEDGDVRGPSRGACTIASVRATAARGGDSSRIPAYIQ